MISARLEMASLFLLSFCVTVLIGITEADLQCGPNERVDNCPADCASDHCPKSEKEVQSCPQPEECPKPACKCIFNYRRADNGTCIPTTQCPPFDCTARRHERFNPCPPLCPTDDCSQATPSGDCPIIFGNIGLVLPCTPKCRCIEHYWRKNGICVPYSQCHN